MSREDSIRARVIMRLYQIAWNNLFDLQASPVSMENIISVDSSTRALFLLIGALEMKYGWYRGPLMEEEKL